MAEETCRYCGARAEDGCWEWCEDRTFVPPVAGASERRERYTAAMEQCLIEGVDEPAAFADAAMAVASADGQRGRELVIREAEYAVWAERLIDDTSDAEARAYNRAISDAVAAIRSLAPRED